MDATTILNAFFSIVGVASFGLLAYFGWLYLSRAGRDRTRPLPRTGRARAAWARAARAA